MPFTTLPPLVAAPVSAGARLIYIRSQLARAYPGAPVQLLGYAATDLVQLPELAGEFFARRQPWPDAPNWREWQGVQLPFFFDADPDAPLLTYAGGRAVLGADVVAAAFYLLSGWQEYYAKERDQYGRFPYAASVQAKYGFVEVPVVNYYLEILKTALEQVSGLALAPRRWGNERAQFAAFVSHDVDNLYSAWKQPAAAALRGGRVLEFGRRWWQHRRQTDAWDNLEAVAEAVAGYGGRSTFFVLANHGAGLDGASNADYELTPRLLERLRKLRAGGCEVSLHGSLGTAGRVNTLRGELDRIGHQGAGLRLHYLSWEPRTTPGVVGEVSFHYDSTLGFAEHYGFRHSYCLPFYLFDFRAAEESFFPFMEIPLNVMDTTLHHPQYLQLAPDAVLPALTPMLTHIQRFGGVASILWHNQNFDPANEVNGPRQFHELMQHLQAQGATFRTGEQIYAEFVRVAPPLAVARREAAE